MVSLHGFLILLLISRSFCNIGNPQTWAVEFLDDSASAIESFEKEMGVSLVERLHPWNVYIFSRIISSNVSHANNRIFRSYNGEGDVLEMLAMESMDSASAPTSPIQISESKIEKRYRLMYRSKENTLMAKYNVRWIEKQQPMNIELRNYVDLGIEDPSYPAQWYLNGKSKYGLNITYAWNSGYTGKTINIAVVDSCINYTHPDLVENYAGDEYDFSGMAKCTHGTAVSGVVSSAKNEYCGVGVAYDSNLFSIPIYFGHGMASQHEIARGYIEKVGYSDIYINSWGPPDDGLRLEGPGPLLSQAIDYCVEHGRNGKGSIYIWASGNGYYDNDRCSYDGYASNRKVICVGAVNFNGYSSGYSEGCPSLLVSAPSSETYEQLSTTIHTTGIYDLCRKDFGGTSASCSMAAGVVALILQANPDLNWLQVQDVLVRTAVKPNYGTYRWVVNGAGLNFNYYYGFGIIDAYSAVIRALSGGYSSDHILTKEYKLRIFMLGGAKICNEGYIPFKFNASFKVHHLEVSVKFNDYSSIKCFIGFYSPAGTGTTFQRSSNNRELRDEWVHTAKCIWGENSKGEWKIVFIYDGCVSIKTMSVTLYGSPSEEVQCDNSQVFYY